MEGAKSIGQTLDQAGELFRKLTPGQRVFLAGSAVLVGSTLWLFVSLIEKPNYTQLHSDPKPTDAPMLGTRSAARNIPYELSSNGIRPENGIAINDAGKASLQPLGAPEFSTNSTLDRELTSALTRTLEAVVGQDRVRATVNVEFDTGTSELTEEVYPADLQTVPTQSSSPAPTFAVGKSVRHIIQPAGRIKRMVVLVLVNEATEAIEKTAATGLTSRKRTVNELKQIEKIAAASIGLDPSRGDTMTVRSLSFRMPPAEIPGTLTTLEKIRQTALRWSGLLRHFEIALLFLIVYFLILRPFKKQVLLTLSNLPAQTGNASQPPIHSETAALDRTDDNNPALRTIALKKQVSDRMKGAPAVASRVIQNWIRDGAKE